uniref:Magnesium transporter n=1 Tax=Entomoneis paludosa TaxID=265537 RepID=A0A7S2Y6K2_9STRA
MEGVLRHTVNSYSRRVRLYEPIVDNSLEKVASDVYSNTGIHLLAPLKDSLQSFEISVQQSVDCLAKLLDDDDAMLDLLLTEQKAAADAGTQVDFQKHEQVELLLGVYARQLAVILQEIKYMLGRIQSKQEFVALAMAGYRNRLVRMNVHISIAGLSLAVGTTVAGFFGMNLISGLEDNAIAFYYVIASTTLCGGVVAMTSLNYISGSSMRKRAEQRLEEIETLGSALSDMCALEYTLKYTIQEKKRLRKEEFRDVLRNARRSSRITDAEVDLLFDVFDRVKNGEIASDDLPFLDFIRVGTSNDVKGLNEK